MNLTPIDELIESWVRVREKEEALKACARDGLDEWWREALANLRPTPKDDEILEGGEEKR